MTCKKCNTRVPGGQRHCPNCGVAATHEPLPPSNGPVVLPDPDLSTAKAEVCEDDVIEPGDSSRALEADTGAEAAQVEDTGGVDLDEASQPLEPPPAPQPLAPPPVAAPSPLASSDAAGLRRLLANDPDLLEPGLEVYCDAEGTPLGAHYVSGVGEIDLLAVDALGRLVVVMISEQSEGEALVAEVLQRIGWVRKHVADASDPVRGIVLCEQAPEGLSYSATAVADTVQFKTWRVALRFDDLEI